MIYLPVAAPLVVGVVASPAVPSFSTCSLAKCCHPTNKTKASTPVRLRPLPSHLCRHQSKTHTLPSARSITKPRRTGATREQAVRASYSTCVLQRRRRRRSAAWGPGGGAGSTTAGGWCPRWRRPRRRSRRPGCCSSSSRSTASSRRRSGVAAAWSGAPTRRSWYAFSS